MQLLKLIKMCGRDGTMISKDEILIDGMIFHGPGCCPECGAPLIVADTETTIMELDPNGIPISESTGIQVGAICSRCKNKIPMVRWEGGYIPFSPSSYLIKCLEREDKAKERVRLLNSDAVSRNPFSISG